MKKLLLSVPMLWALMCQHSFAQQLNNTLDSVTIQENRIKEPYGKQNRNIQVIDSRQIKALPVKTLNEVLSYAAGVDLRQRGPVGMQADVSIDGSTFDQVLVLVNGVKMSDPQTGHHLLNIPIPIGAIDHIEILRGPAARSYGVNALAGAINIVTKVPMTNDVFVQAYGGSGFVQDTATGDAYYNWGAQASVALAGEKQTHILSIAHDEGNGYRYNTAYDANRIFYQNKFTLNDKNSVEAMGGYINNNFGANAYYAAPGDKESVEKVQTGLGSIRYQYKPTDKVTISPRVSYRYNNDDYVYIRQKPDVYHNIHETNVITGEIQSSIRLKKGIIGAGVEYRNEDNNSTNLGKRQRNNLGIFAEYKHYFSEKLNAGAGVYANKNSDYDWELFPGIDAGYRFLPQWKIFVNATTGQRLPTYTDLYYKGPTNIGNAQLQPEYAKYAEGGIRLDNPVVFAQAAYFYRHNRDFIDWVRTLNTDPWQPQNYQSVITQGVTLQANYMLGEHVGLADKYQITINGNYTYLSPAIQVPGAGISKYAIEALRHQATFGVNTLLFNHVQANVTYRYLYRINANDYTVIDARLGYQYRGLLVYADVNNLLNTKYKEVATVPMMPRWFTVGLRVNTSWK